MFFTGERPVCARSPAPAGELHCQRGGKFRRAFDIPLQPAQPPPHALHRRPERQHTRVPGAPRSHIGGPWTKAPPSWRLLLTGLLGPASRYMNLLLPKAHKQAAERVYSQRSCYGGFSCLMHTGFCFSVIDSHGNRVTAHRFLWLSSGVHKLMFQTDELS